MSRSEGVNRVWHVFSVFQCGYKKLILGALTIAFMRTLLLFTVLFYAVGLSAQTDSIQKDNDNWKIYLPKKADQLRVEPDTNQVKAEPDTNRVKLVFQPASGGMGDVKIVTTNPYIDSLRKEYNRLGKRTGYRVLIYRGKSSANAKSNKTRFLQNRDDRKVYVEYLEPNFLVTVGNFRTRLESMRFLKEIKSKYPNAYIIRAKIDAIAFPNRTGEVVPDDPDSTDQVPSSGSGGEN